MRELVDADSANVPAASTGGDASQQREIVSRGNRWDTAAESVGPEARGVESHVGRMSVGKGVGYEGVEAWWECCPQHVGRTKAGT